VAEPILETRDLTKSYGALRANDGVSLTVVPRETHAIIGPNGAGKTTLISQIAGEVAPTSGHILFRGRDVTGLPAYRRAALGLARTFQITSIIKSFTALENVATAAQARAGHSFRFWGPADRAEDINATASAALERTGLGVRADVPSISLAHGEHRQLEIAMALAAQPSLLLLDEPTAGMGPDESQQIVRLLRQLKADVAILLIEHDMDVVFSVADRLTVLVNGRVLATGAPDEIRRDPRVREAYLGDEFAAA
jgi:branched-chain amino acid transport system ATP-binding protein